MTISEAKKEYNKLLKRYYDGCKYFEREDISLVEKEKYLPNFQQILRNLNYLLGKIGVYTAKEVMEGFNEE